jgi:hypothetical protein
MTVQTEVDPVFGDVRVRVEPHDALVRVEGLSVPSAELQRRPGAIPDPYSPIGTRDGARLALYVSGSPSRILPGKGHLTRGSYRVDVQHGTTRYRLVPNSGHHSALRRDGTWIGTLCADGDGGESARWLPDQCVEPTDASIGYLLAASFGTGGQHVLLSLFGFGCSTSGG